MSEDANPVKAGWYPAPEAAPAARQVRYWDGTAWTGIERRAGSGGKGPRDIPGRVALILLVAGFLGTIGVPLALSSAGSLFSGTFISNATLVDLAATPVALIFSIVGLVRAHDLKFQAPLSLVILVLSVIGTVLLALPIALFVTGVWVLPHI